MLSGRTRSNKQKDKLVDLFEKLAAERKNPLVVLRLPVLLSPVLLELFDLIDGEQFEQLDVLLDTPGGDIGTAYQVVKYLRSKTKILNILVPFFAKSAGTLICLGADHLVMGEFAELGPLDTQIRETQEGKGPEFVSTLNGFKALEQIQKHTFETLMLAMGMIRQKAGLRVAEAIKLATDFAASTSGSLYSKLDPYRIGEYARALEIGERYGNRILKELMNWSASDADTLIRELVRSYPEHGYIIDYDELVRLGLPVEKANENIRKLFRDMIKELFERDERVVQVIIPPARPSVGTLREDAETQKEEELHGNEVEQTEGVLV